MAILRGFPPSHAITCGTRFPAIVETSIPVSLLSLGNRFKHNSGEYLFLEIDLWSHPRAICYVKGPHETVGSIYGFDYKTEVIWLREDWSYGKEQFVVEKEKSVEIERFVSKAFIEGQLSVQFGGEMPFKINAWQEAWEKGRQVEG